MGYSASFSTHALLCKRVRNYPNTELEVCDHGLSLDITRNRKLFFWTRSCVGFLLVNVSLCLQHPTGKLSLEVEHS